ncbi:hypothetical protein B6S44_10910 [Bosea sp. Tri-44]|uniref:hypothetical protein n=1 Tax=Bosea sp. Tri-44 TaxID=1972137 RepID=UPI00100F5481|nr:hypothetical protein [Bosea sp. Tri-44]RXT55123.1 hypothetical protein B6S44_10910 [Bosea sp. Tri-44]
MTVALIIVMAAYFIVASLTALNSVFETERSVLAAKDLAVIALVSMAWAFVGCALLLAQACRRTSLRKRGFLPAVR